MSAPLRFLALIVVGWAGVRAATLGMIPGFTVGYAKTVPPSPVPPIVPTSFPPLPPIEAAMPQQLPAAYYPAPPVVYYPAYGPPQSFDPQPIAPRPRWNLQPLQASANDDWPIAQFASAAFPERRSVPISLPASPAKPRLDRIQLTTWAYLRGAPSPGALATGGTLGGSQGGARLTYAFNRFVAASLRTTSPMGGSTGAEVAGGLRFKPFRSIPIAITAERRQSISPHGGRSAFALFAEGGLYRRPMPWQFNLDAYVQGGIVGFSSRDLFVDGALAFTRPVYGRFSAGFGVWGGAQPGVYRVDAGPRVSIRVRDDIYAHVDWRQRLVGNARPASGPSLTLAADF